MSANFGGAALWLPPGVHPNGEALESVFRRTAKPEPAMKTTIEALEQAGLRQQVKVVVGGAPVTAQYADEIGADGFAANANAAVTLTRRLTAS